MSEPQQKSLSTAIDKKAFCASAYQYECERTEKFDLWAGFCITNPQMPDSSAMDFSLAENRLNYILVHGCSVISFVEKGVLTYLEGLSALEKMFFMKKTVICTMSNGPGFDIVGYFSALQKCGLKLDDALELQCISSSQSWQPLFKWIITYAYRKIGDQNQLSHCYSVGDLMNVNRLNILGFKRFDYYDILLMVRAFQSPKASPEIVSTTMTEIFTRLKRGSLIFYFGSKPNVQRVVQIALKLSSICVKLDPVKIVIEEDNSTSYFVQDDCKPKSQFIFFTVFEKQVDLETKTAIVPQNQPSLDLMDSKSWTSDSSDLSSVSNSSSVCNSKVRPSIENGLDSSSSKTPSVPSLRTPLPSSKTFSNVSADKRNDKNISHMSACQSGQLTLQTSENDNLGFVRKNILEQIIQESVHKALENLFHASDLKLCSRNPSELVCNDSLAKIVKESACNSSRDAHEPLINLGQTSKSSLTNLQLDEYGSKCKLSKSVQTSDNALKKNSNTVKTEELTFGMLGYKNEKTAKQLTSSNHSNCLEHKEANTLKYQSLNSLIEKCQNLISTGKKLVSNVHDQTEHSSMDRSCIHKCCVQDFHEHNNCEKVSHLCHFDKTYFDHTDPCCCYKDLSFSCPCPCSYAMQSCCRISSCHAVRPCCRSFNAKLNQKSCCQNLSCNENLKSDGHGNTD